MATVGGAYAITSSAAAVASGIPASAPSGIPASAVGAPSRVAPSAVGAVGAIASENERITSRPSASLRITSRATCEGGGGPEGGGSRT